MSDAKTVPGPDDSPPLTAADVIACYRYILGREPESEAVIQRHLDRAATLEQLRAAFFRSREFRAQNWEVLPLPASFVLPPIKVETEAAPEALAAMLGRVALYWGAIGREAPHWSVLTHARYLPAEIEQNREEFYAGGERDAVLVTNLLHQHAIPLQRIARVLEFGCGVGRVTFPLARRFPEVIGCDVSAAHLEVAGTEAAARGSGNISWHQSTVDKPLPDLDYDLLFSRIVLQHNPPPVMAWLLRQAFARLRPGGIAIFQLPTLSLIHI